MALVSIITPVYNSAAFIKQTYESISAQTVTDWEWLVVDDCSTDDSVKIIKSIADDRIKLIVLNHNSGASEARNQGLKQVEGRYITFIDSDDLWKEDFLEKSINYLQQHNEALVYSNYERVNDELVKILPDFEAVDYVDFKRLLYNCPIPMLTALYDKEKVGLVKIPDVPLREDHAMWLDIMRRIPHARALNEALGIYRIRDNSVSRNKIKIAFKQFDVYYRYLNLNVFSSVFYTICWAFNGLKKYGKL
ncbi:glycosyltransferase family 2 protein [Vaginella massiliensis]|uniref:glycosyltransferase family 2 protein n=1 Tax=Vaginella massiliensis TaxID=1816680 RepID=UPI0008383743|nr:glycosyltransferase family 2 protein [Vaginella massiliensis]